MEAKRTGKANSVSGRVLRLTAALLCVTAAASCVSSRLLARYRTETAGSDSVRVALWAAAADFSDSGMAVDANAAYDETDGCYTFTVEPNGSEVASEYGVRVTLTDPSGVTAWPSGVTVKLTDGDGSNARENATGVFDDLGTFEPGETDGDEYRLYVKAAETVKAGTYGVNITVTVEQAD